MKGKTFKGSLDWQRAVWLGKKIKHRSLQGFLSYISHASWDSLQSCKCGGMAVPWLPAERCAQHKTGWTCSAMQISALTSTRLLYRNLIKRGLFSCCSERYYQLSWESFKFSQDFPPSIQVYFSNQLLKPLWIFDLEAAWPFLGLWYKMNK